MNVRASPGGTAAERLEIVETADGLAALAEPWTRLWRDCGALVFQSHGWISAWWGTIDDPRRSALRIGLVWRGERLVAVLPLAITRRKGLRFLEWAAIAHSDYGDLIRAPDCPEAALDRLWALVCAAGGFDLAFVNRLQPDAAAWRLFDPGKAHPVRLRPNHRQEISSRIAGGWESGAAWLAGHPKKTRQNYRRGIKMLEEAGTVAFRLLGPEEPLDPVLERLSALKRQWLVRNARSSVLFDDGKAALEALVAVLARAGVLRLFVIEVNGTAVAISVNFVERDTLMAWVTSYDPEFARASPGTVLIFDYVQWAIDHGLGGVDLLCGGEAFKDKLATEVVPLRSLIGAGSAKGALALFVDGLRRRFAGFSRRGAEIDC
ncbi:GNAT family N-acetyltransferase [Bosea sp. (in: a-proteobacteria)]|uniref:GNAT family N-acetyltransferase n=1 Tax=Bosea sp. (in: a-proteobacteria) TaxID=1871050 RepID=UPI00260C95A7|nr:GNAT family N-acetyltransferase [Bosea sp. (in: a-proteobacteria)]MCO5090842.1 GNAT family N-acetyltransferase [Bosea sp. (in: a-proteobacteria)]